MKLRQDLQEQGPYLVFLSKSLTGNLLQAGGCDIPRHVGYWECLKLGLARKIGGRVTGAEGNLAARCVLCFQQALLGVLLHTAVRFLTENCRFSGWRSSVFNT